MQCDKIQRQEEAKKLREANIFINKDISRETMELRKQLWKEVKAHRDKGSVA